MIIKIFEHTDPDKLTEKVNKWLANYKYTATIKSIQYTSTGVGGSTREDGWVSFSVMIQYSI